MANKEGLQRAFVHFAAEGAVLMRSNKIIDGKHRAIAFKLFIVQANRIAVVVG